MDLVDDAEGLYQKQFCECRYANAFCSLLVKVHPQLRLREVMGLEAIDQELSEIIQY